MKKFILFIFLAFILLFGFYIISTQNYLSNYINNVTTTKPMVTSKIPVIDKTINEDIDNYIIDIKYPHFNILEFEKRINKIQLKDGLCQVTIFNSGLDDELYKLYSYDKLIYYNEEVHKIFLDMGFKIKLYIF